MGELIVTNECLIEGNLQGTNLQDFYNNRAKFISKTYNVTPQSYFDKVVIELDKIENLPNNAEVNLWFEEDLFCQVNFWFVLYLIKQQTNIRSVYLVLPNKENRYGFGGMDTNSLIESFNHKIEITESEFATLSGYWELYRNEEFARLIEESKKSDSKYPFLLPAINAHIDRFPKNGKLGRPEQTILNIMKELQTENFSLVFREFCKREPVYGFGDSQVKHLFNGIISTKMNNTN
ncbi:MAG: DUF1835 domain-containing protein [Gammaproteobacteria bacterium]|nr:MAG: DUF1835 domain-containing protein [Gammaproteobacteria bacterium]